MIEQHIHLYEQLPLFGTGIAMGIILILIHLAAILQPNLVLGTLSKAHLRPQWGAALMCVDFVWIALLLLDAPWNPLTMPLFSFEFSRSILLFLCPVVCFVMCVKSQDHLFARALALFLLLLALVPMSAAFLKDPITRILIPLWWYPVLTVAMFWIVKPYLLRDWTAWLQKHMKVYHMAAWAGLAYGVAILACAILFW